MTSIEISDAQIAPYLPYPYTDLARFNDATGPVSLVLPIRPGQVMSLHGTEHTNSPDAPQYIAFRECWREYLDATEGNPVGRLAITEGRVHEATPFLVARNPEAAAIQCAGAGALTCLWAQQRDIAIKRPESPNYAEIGQLLHRFSADEIVTTYGIRQASQLPDQWKEGDQTPHDAYIGNFLEGELRAELTRRAEFRNYDFSYDHFVAVHKRLLGVEPTEQGVRTYRDLLKSFIKTERSDCSVVEVSRESFYRRNLFTGKTLISDLATGRSPFGNYGWFHVRALEGLFRIVAGRLREGKPAFPEI